MPGPRFNIRFNGHIMKSLIAGFIFPLMLAAGLAQAGVSIVFDYSLDSNGFFTSERRAIAQAAADSLTSRMANTHWARVDTSMVGGSYELAIVNPSTMEVSWVPNVVIPENQITVRLGAMDWSTAPVSRFRGSSGDSATQLLSIRNVSGGIAAVLTSASRLRPVDASISFDLQGIRGLKPGITRQWYFGSVTNLNTDDRNPADPYYSNYSDFYTSMVHELGHILGIYDPVAASGILLPSDPNFHALMASDPNFGLAWTSRVQSDGSGGYVFTGPRASQFYFNHAGQPIPLLSDDRSHWADGVHSQSADRWPSVTHDRNTPFRYGYSELEFAAMEDMGYTINPAVSVPTRTAVDCIFNWAERTYRELFAPAGVVSATWAPYYFRYYSGTANYLAASSTDNHIWLLGPVSGNSLHDVGLITNFMAAAGCTQ